MTNATEQFDEAVVESIVGEQPKANIIREQELIDPEPKDEKQDVELKTEYTVLVNGKKIQLTTDKLGSSLLNKLSSNGIHLQDNGDIIVLSGSNEEGKACGGRMLINTKGGQIVKSGPVVTEIVADSNSSTEGSGSGTTETSGTSEVAKSDILYGDWEVETLGTIYLRGTNITIDATEILTLSAKEKIVMQTGEVVQASASSKEITGQKDTNVTGPESTNAAETTLTQLDPRSTQSVVSSGHINRVIKGDYNLSVMGVGAHTYVGREFAAPLILNRTSAYTLFAAAGNMSLLTGVGSLCLGAAGGTFGAFIPGSVNLSAATGVNVAGIGAVNINSVLGVNLGAGIPALPALTAGDVKITATKDINLKTTAGNIVAEGKKIYLN